MHIGNLRTGLYAYCIARHFGGQFILRIEDTDRKRNVPKSIQVIYDSLKLAGLNYDEGPDKGGSFGPYVQSQRQAQGIYQNYAETLVENGGAYRCFCQKDETENKTSRTKDYDPCRFLTPAEVESRMHAGDPSVIRQRIPEGGETTFVDRVYGRITVQNRQLDDQVLLKSDDFPTYNFANVVDDHLMAITHVVRGVEYLSSTPKYNLLYASFGWDVPEYIHCPHIVKEDGKKLAKRAGDASFQDLIARGFLPEAILNGVALLGWAPGDDREFFTLEDLVRDFDIDRINKSKAAFSLPKLAWLNGEHLHKLPLERFHAMALSYYPEKIKATCNTSRLSQVIQSRTDVLADIPAKVGFLADLPDYDLVFFVHDKSRSSLDSSRKVLGDIGPVIQSIDHWDEEAFRTALQAYIAQTGLKTSAVMWPIRIALSGQLTTPGGATEIADILGKDESLKRIDLALERLNNNL
jgi:glutamyl-tRNA synthetase